MFQDTQSRTQCSFDCCTIVELAAWAGNTGSRAVTHFAVWGKKDKGHWIIKRTETRRWAMRSTECGSSKGERRSGVKCPNFKTENEKERAASGRDCGLSFVDHIELAGFR